MYYLKLISLENCPYSEAANQLVNSNNIKSEIYIVKQKEKNKFKTTKIRTFPQIYLKKKNSSGDVLIGGYSNLKSYFDDINNDKINITNMKNKIMNEVNGISEKGALRLIELLIV